MEALRLVVSGRGHLDLEAIPNDCPANLRAAMACTVTNLAASTAGLTWMLWVSGVYIVIVPIRCYFRTTVSRRNGLLSDFAVALSLV